MESASGPAGGNVFCGTNQHQALRTSLSGPSRSGVSCLNMICSSKTRIWANAMLALPALVYLGTKHKIPEHRPRPSACCAKRLQLRMMSIHAFTVVSIKSPAPPKHGSRGRDLFHILHCFRITKETQHPSFGRTGGRAHGKKSKTRRTKARRYWLISRGEESYHRPAGR